MVKVVVLYAHPEDKDAFNSYYASTHAPIAEKIPGLKRFEHGVFVGGADGSAAPYHYLAELTFESMEDLQAGMGSAEGQAAGADVANFAEGLATILIAQA